MVKLYQLSRNLDSFYFDFSGLFEYSFRCLIKKKNATKREENSATIIDIQMPFCWRISGKMNKYKIGNMKLLKKEIIPETKPLLRAVNIPVMKIPNPANKYENE